MASLGWHHAIGDLHRPKRRRSTQLLLPSEKNPRRDPMAPCYSRQGRPRLQRLFDDLTLICVAEIPPMPVPVGGTIGRSTSGLAI